MRHQTGGYRLAGADCRRGIPLADGCVQTVVTSPPYWGLRDYGETGQIGLEPSPEGYVARLVELFRDIRRVLRDDGTVFLNLGDSYFGGGGYSPDSPSNQPEAAMQRDAPRAQTNGARIKGMSRSTSIWGLKPKDLIGIPWRVALALQADGWYLRSDIIWSKPNPMPESVTDRPTRSHEYIFLLSKQANYYYDHEAIREPMKPTSGLNMRAPKCGDDRINGTTNQTEKTYDEIKGANKRSVWTVATRSFPGSHFATFPPELITPCIQAGTSEKGQCPHCGDPWMRMVESVHRGATQSTNGRGDPRMSCPSGKAIGSDTRGMPSRQSSTLGWSSSCLCDPAPPEPQIVLDPFNGAGTAGVVALALGRRYVGLDLSPKYLRMARRRIERPHSVPERPRREESHPLFCEDH